MRPGAHDRSHRLRHLGGDLLLGGRAHQAGDRRLQPLVLGASPGQPEQGRRRHADEEPERAERGEQRDGERERRAALAARAGQDDRGSDRYRGRGQELEPAAGDAGGSASPTPESDGDDDGEDRPVQQEGDDEGREAGRARLAIGRDLGERVRPGENDDRHQPEPLLQAARRWLEGGAEAIEQVGEEDERGDQRPLEECLQRRVGRLVDQWGQVDDERERPERECGPEPGSPAAQSPLP